MIEVISRHMMYTYSNPNTVWCLPMRYNGGFFVEVTIVAHRQASDCIRVKISAHHMATNHFYHDSYSYCKKMAFQI